MSSALKQAGLLAGLFFLQSTAHATTFGPIPVVDQVRGAQYAIRGNVIGDSWVKYAPDVNKPYTYWKISIAAQQIGDSLGSEVEIRQPGGEIGPFGYHMAGTAEFARDEDTFILLHDTPEKDVKEIVGLTSGKYRVETAINGKKIVVNGLGLPVNGEDGAPFSPEEFSDLLQRISRNEATEKDRNIFVNRTAAHEHADAASEAASRAREKEVRAILERRPAETGSAPKTFPAKQPDSQANTIQESPASAEEPSTGSSASWVFALVVVIGLLVGLVLILRR